jgi:hypothetical protein
MRGKSASESNTCEDPKESRSMHNAEFSVHQVQQLVSGLRLNLLTEALKITEQAVH